MATFSSVTRQHVLAAIAEYDARGADDFLAVYGFAPARGDELVHEGRRYDATAILGVAHRYATGRLATPDEVHGGSSGAAEVLRRRGFEVASPAATVRDTPTARRSARAAGPARRANAAERPPAICPTCFTALPATGICDTCG